MSPELAAMECIIWCVHVIIRKLKGGVLFKFVEFLNLGNAIPLDKRQQGIVNASKSAGKNIYFSLVSTCENAFLS